VRSVVIDASAALAWILPSQSSAVALEFLGNAGSMAFEAPAILEWEVRNVLLTMERRGPLGGSRYEKALADYDELQIRLNPPTGEVESLAAFAREVRLSLFDVCYLALAIDRNWALASRDEALLKVAAASGVECFDLRAAT
jgi:predicted nucleic acid-binding protein